MKNIKSILEPMLNVVFPIDERCMFCRKPCVIHKHYLCESCYNSLRKINFSCRHCGEVLDKTGIEICRKCMNNPGPFTGISGAYFLDDIAKTAIYDYKEGRRRELSYCFSSILCEKISESFWGDKIDIIVGVPSSKNKISQRGFDHIKDISRKVCDELEIPEYPLLKLSKEAREQKSLNAEERYKNMKNHFQLSKMINMPISILIIDDVITTGATMNACAMALQKVNAKIYGVSVFSVGSP